MNKYIFRLTYSDGYTTDLEVTGNNIYNVWSYAMGIAASRINTMNHGELEQITKLYEISG